MQFLVYATTLKKQKLCEVNTMFLLLIYVETVNLECIVRTKTSIVDVFNHATGRQL